jgi:hypothetical protein
LAVPVERLRIDSVSLSLGVYAFFFYFACISSFPFIFAENGVSKGDQGIVPVPVSGLIILATGAKYGGRRQMGDGVPVEDVMQGFYSPKYFPHLFVSPWLRAWRKV